MFATKQVTCFGCRKVSSGHDSSNPPYLFVGYILNNNHVAFIYLKYTIQVMRPLVRSNLVSCEFAPVDRTVVLTCGVYTISVDFGLSLQNLVTLVGHTAILTCGVLPPQR